MEGDFLPPGRHHATLDEIHQRFVTDAPNPERREIIFHAFMAWALEVWTLLPTARLWVDGGFMTHKNGPPKDIDVAILARGSEVEALSDEQYNSLTALLTDPTPGARVQPMGGLVDGFLLERGVPASIEYWSFAWSGVYDENGTRTDAEKGYVVVKP